MIQLFKAKYGQTMNNLLEKMGKCIKKIFVMIFLWGAIYVLWEAIENYLFESYDKSIRAIITFIVMLGGLFVFIDNTVLDEKSKKD